jgi:N-acetylmuramoyl-L-alanine amidase
MIPIGIYLLKVTICSAILFMYYLAALRNKLFHSWNRFYLLAAVVLSITVPLIKITVQKPDDAVIKVTRFIQVINGNPETEYFLPAEHTAGSTLSLTAISMLIFILVSAMLFLMFSYHLLRIYKLKYKSPISIIEGVNFISTEAKGTPFSFFNNIFWNNKIDIMSENGRRIFRHELAHVEERHSHDKVFLNVMLIFYWANPFFWLIKNELSLIHEFIADKKAVGDGDTASFSAMILQAVYPQYNFNMTNSFFFKPLKRRLHMLVKSNPTRTNYFTRILVLPLAVLLFLSFTLKTNSLVPKHYTGRIINVVIDAGHGGDDAGAVGLNGITEKDITLALAKKIKSLNVNDKLNIILTRTEDKSISVYQRAQFAQSVQADLFISLHLDAQIGNNTNSGASIVIPKNDNRYIEQSKLLGLQMIGAFKSNYHLPVNSDLVQHENGIWVLKENKYPAVLIETAFITNKEDVDFITKDANLEIIARNILNAIEKYESAQDGSTSLNTLREPTDTEPFVKRQQRDIVKEEEEIKKIAKGKEQVAYVYKNRYYLFYNMSATNYWEPPKMNVPVVIDGRAYNSPSEINNHVKRSEITDIRRIEKQEALTKYSINEMVLEVDLKHVVLTCIPSRRRNIISAINVEYEYGKGLVGGGVRVTVEGDAMGVKISDHPIIVFNGLRENVDCIKNKHIVAKTIHFYSGDDEEVLKQYGEEAKDGVLVFEGATISEMPIAAKL